MGQRSRNLILGFFALSLKYVLHIYMGFILNSGKRSSIDIKIEIVGLLLVHNRLNENRKSQCFDVGEEDE